jgi:hypothetical protein
MLSSPGLIIDKATHALERVVRLPTSVHAPVDGFRIDATNLENLDGRISVNSSPTPGVKIILQPSANDIVPDKDEGLAGPANGFGDGGVRDRSIGWHRYQAPFVDFRCSLADTGYANTFRSRPRRFSLSCTRLS